MAKRREFGSGPARGRICGWVAISDAIWIKVEQTGAACHTGRRSCFYRGVTRSEGGEAKVSFIDAEKLFVPTTSITGNPDPCVAELTRH